MHGHITHKYILGCELTDTCKFDYTGCLLEDECGECIRIALTCMVKTVGLCRQKEKCYIDYKWMNKDQLENAS